MSAARVPALAVLLAGPTVLAFFAGGYFDEGREWAGIVAWLLVVIAAIATPEPLPRGLAGRLAVIGLATLVAWTAVSMAWAPLGGPAQDDVQRGLLYLGAFLAAIALLRGRQVTDLVEPALAAGALVVIGYGLAGRLVPDLVAIDPSASAFGRLEQPLTYWNAMGALAAIGLILAARVAGDGDRDPRLRGLAAAAGAPLGLGVYLSFSRAAILAVVVGAIVVLALVRERRQLRAILLTAGAGAVASIPAGISPWVRTLEAEGSQRTLEGGVTLVLLAAVALATFALGLRWFRDDEPVSMRMPRPRWIALAVVVLLAGGTIAAAATERAGNPSTGATTARLASVESNRSAYWAVAVRQFADDPLAGAGAGAFRVAWLRERTVDDPAKDAHSLYLETAAELGLVGLLALALFLAGLAVACARAYRAAPALAAGPTAVVVAWAVHAGLDWDWEMPAVTLVALIAAGSLVVQSEPPEPANVHSDPL